MARIPESEIERLKNEVSAYCLHIGDHPARLVRRSCAPCNNRK